MQCEAVQYVGATVRSRCLYDHQQANPYCPAFATTNSEQRTVLGDRQASLLTIPQRPVCDTNGAYSSRYKRLKASHGPWSMSDFGNVASATFLEIIFRGGTGGVVEVRIANGVKRFSRKLLHVALTKGDVGGSAEGASFEAHKVIIIYSSASLSLCSTISATTTCKFARVA